MASVSPQTRANIAATFGVSEREAGHIITQLLSGTQGLRSGGAHGNGFTWVLDTNVLRDAALVLAADEVSSSLSSPPGACLSSDDGAASTNPRKPVLTSACPGWICYAEKTHAYILPYLSRLKSPQALAGTLVKSVLAQAYNVSPEQIWHLAVMPCFDKKLEASRSELMSSSWDGGRWGTGIRDVDCVITARELLLLASARGIDIRSLPRKPVAQPAFPDETLNAFLFPHHRRGVGDSTGGTSGGYLWHIMQTFSVRNPGSRIEVSRGRNADVIEYSLVQNQQVLLQAARFYGFRNIQNLVRRLKPAKLSKMPGAGARRVGARKPGATNGASTKSDKEYAYVEVMACPGGCTNGGGQVKAVDLGTVGGVLDSNVDVDQGLQAQKEWLGRVDEAYFSASSDEDSDLDSMDIDTPADPDVVNGISTGYIQGILKHWAALTGVEKEKLVYTSYRKVESDIGKKMNDVERVAGLASSIGGGW